MKITMRCLSLHPLRMAIVKKTKNHAGKDVEKGALLWHHWGNVNYYRHYGKQFRGFSKSLK
jgi:hypothetical protein